MRNQMRSKLAIAAVAAVISVVGIGLPAQAADRSSNPTNDESAKSKAAVLEALPDSLSGEEAVATETHEKDGYRVTTQTFADGSESVTGVEIGVEATPAQLAQMVAEAEPYVPDEYDGGGPIAVPMATGIDQCTYGNSAGVHYAQNCHVYYHGISWSSSFRANYQQWSGGSGAQYINGTYNTVTFTGCISQEEVVSMDSGTRVRYRFNFMPACWASVPFWLDLKVTSTSAYATYGP